MRHSESAVLIAVVLGLLLATPAGAWGAAEAEGTCAETKVDPSAEGAAGLNEIAPSASRPTFDVALGDDPAHEDQVGLPPKTGNRFADPGEVSVEVIDWPAAGSSRLDGRIDVAAVVNASRTRVQVFACVDGRSQWDAGRYEGNILISGPEFADFTYPMVITARFPWWLAVAILVAAAVVFFAIAYGTSSLIYQSEREGKKLVGTFLGVAFAVVAMVPVYWSSYLDNPTWGANPDSEFLALGVAGFTAATVGSAAAHRLLGGTQQVTGAPQEDEPKAET